MTHSSNSNSAPRVSIVIPAYNAQKYLTLTVESVLNQTIGDWECVIVDDGSNDDTVQVARALVARDARIQLVEQSNAGVSAARNHGLEKSDRRAPFVAFLDADDLWEPPMLQTLLEALEGDADCVAAHSIAYYIDGEGQRIREGVLEEDGRRRYPLKGKRIVREITGEATTFSMTAAHHTITTPGCVLIRRRALDEVGAFNPKFRFSEDWDLWVRLSRLSPLLFVDQPLLAYRRHQQNSSLNRKQAASQNREVRRLIIEAPENTPEQRQTALRAYRAFYWYMAQDRYRKAWKHLKNREFKRSLHALAMGLVNALMVIKGRP